MPKAKRYTEKRFVMLTPAQARQLERLSQHQEVSVPELIRTALRQHYSPGRRNPTVSRGCTIPRDVRNRGDAGGGNHSAQLSGLFPEAACGLPWAPRLTHELLDRTTLEPGAVGGGVGSRITQARRRDHDACGGTPGRR